ncbi:unnamed protein product, partial [Brassica oleracea var. botrytis]
MSESFKTTVDPLLKDVDGKKESFRRNVVSMAAEIKQVRGRLVSQEQAFQRQKLRTWCRSVNCRRSWKIETVSLKLQLLPLKMF